MQIEDTQADAYLLALVIFREAAGEPHEGKAAVGYSVLTRAHNPRWWGKDLYSVITHKEQYSSMTHLGDAMTVVWPPFDDLTFQDCLTVAEMVLDGSIENPAPKATHYCTAAVAAHTKWVDESKFLTQIGHHRFYALEETA